jgi:deoxyribonuclease-1-like protein
VGRFAFVVLLVVACTGGWYVSANYKVDVRRTQDGRLESVRIVARTPTSPSQGLIELPPAAPLRPTLRIATFNLDGLDEAKLARPQMTDALVRIIPRFDVVALQGIRSKNRGVLVRLVEQVNALGKYYDFATCPTLDGDPGESYNAMLLDLTTVEVDRSTVHSVEDPARRFRVKPLVGSFRVRGPPEKEAFTFTLVNVLVDPDHAAAELDLLADVFRAVRDSNPAEDDIIMLGDLEADPEHLGKLCHVPYLTAAVTTVPTTTRGTRLADNILFDRLATAEYTGRSGVLDLIRELDLSPQAALEISEHLPVWAEFSSYEGGQSVHAAGWGSTPK